ncbi:hypothetical protein L3Q82_004273 [Scortum barcoo]|uniref:Uncharacterized protein n=1 Tax=Scortum barcoo TaxID=214431 RepID=A0ACB8VJI2_9TELE|nr:hypothetical protein L3Q82_004273 [Scortum barcoo]
MATAGYDRNIEQINNKLKKLKKDYRDQKRELRRSGAGWPRKSPHFDLLNSVLSDRPACQLTGALNSATVMLECMVDNTFQSSTDPQLSAIKDIDGADQGLLPPRHCSSSTPSTTSSSSTRREKTCPAGWRSFMCSCPLLSSESGSWTRGRDDCRSRGADLVVIGSTEEQITTNIKLVLTIKKNAISKMSEHREEFLLEIEAKLFGLTVKELHRICEYCKIAGKDSEDIKNKTRRALVKHIVKFCEREEFLEREDEGMSVLLDLNDALFGTLREDPAAADNAGAAPLCSPPCGGRCGGGDRPPGAACVGTTGRRQHTAYTDAGNTGCERDGAGRGDSKQRQRVHQQQLLGSQRIQKGLQDKRTCCTGRSPVQVCRHMLKAPALHWGCEPGSVVGLTVFDFGKKKRSLFLTSNPLTLNILNYTIALRCLDRPQE